jgi:hypothetical protein
MVNSAVASVCLPAVWSREQLHHEESVAGTEAPALAETAAPNCCRAKPLTSRVGVRAALSPPWGLYVFHFPRGSLRGLHSCAASRLNQPRFFSIATPEILVLRPTLEAQAMAKEWRKKAATGK